MMSQPQRNTTGEAAASQHENPNRTSKLPSERVVLLVLGSLLAAALIIIYRLSVAVLMTNKTFQPLKEDNETLRRNLSDETCLKCEASWVPHAGNCYYFSSNKSSWNESRRSCRDLGGDLVKIDSREEQMFLIGRLRNMTVDNGEGLFWVGLMDSKEDGRWLWVDGSLLNESFWFGGEPKNWAGENRTVGDGLGMEKNAKHEDLKGWDDRSCDVSHGSICEKSAEMCV